MYTALGIISYILIGILVTALATRFAQYNPNDTEEAPPFIVVAFWPAVGIAYMIYGLVLLSGSSRSLLSKCKKNEKQLSKKIKS